MGNSVGHKFLKVSLDILKVHGGSNPYSVLFFRYANAALGSMLTNSRSYLVINH